MRFFGRFFKSVISVSLPAFPPPARLASYPSSCSPAAQQSKAWKSKARQKQELIFVTTGSRYIYDLYYEKNAISKQLYEWLLKNNYADANLIAKWKKQGYEKVSLQPPFPSFVLCGCLWLTLLVLVMLSPLRTIERNEFQRNLYLSCTEGTT